MHCTEINQNENCENLFDPNEREEQKINNIEENENNITAKSDQAELLQWHYKLGHFSFIKLQYLFKLGILSRRLIIVKPPIYSGCLYGAMYRVPWRRKGKKENEIREATEPGQCVSVDQMESTTPGLIAQLKGRVTTQRYNSVTIFVDHYSRLSYIHLQTSLSSMETKEAKRAFEAFSKERGVRIQHYHADNGRFVDNLFIESIKREGQTISYCGVNAHWQNGIAEKRIRDLTEGARKQLLHATSRWSRAITLNLWPYSLRMQNYLHQKY